MVKGFYQKMIPWLEEGTTSLPILSVHGNQTTHADPFVALVGPVGNGGIQCLVDLIQGTMNGHSLFII
jgi:hypothetical protein